MQCRWIEVHLGMIRRDQDANRMDQDAIKLDQDGSEWIAAVS
jgi:hypothetical protein